MRKAIRKRIKKGDLAAEPEFSLGKDDDDLPFTSSKPRRTDLKSSKQEKVEETALAQDDFFEA